ncbi:MAG TPA: hypothetical protein VLG16_04600 [Candidatus Saccharimonadales bacterium]|nr:hypothetical protein [Candidatus Saccharimonadales bacterium]
MPLSKRYLHDKTVLALVSVNVFLAFISIVLILLRFGANSGANGYIVQYRQNLGIGAFKTGSVGSILSFTAFAPVVAAVNILLSIRMFHIKRELSLVALSLGLLVLTFAIIVSNALLVLR